MAASPSQINFTTMHINKKDIAALESNTNKDKLYNNNKKLIDIEPIDWDDI